MISKAKSADRQFGPVPAGPPRSTGISTILRVSKGTGLTSPNKKAPFGQEINKGQVMPGIAKIFAAVPGVNKSDFTNPYQRLLSENS